MGEKVNPKAKAYAACDPLSSKGEGAVSSCKKGMDVCLSGNEGTFKIDTDVGAVEFEGDQQQCIAKIKKLTGFGYVIAGGVFKPPKTASADLGTEQSASGETEPAPASDSEPAAVENKPPAGDIYAGCKKAGSPGSEGHGTCVSIVDTCQASSEGPYEIFTDAGVIEPNNQLSCMKVAPALAKMGYKLVDPSSSPKAEDAPETPPAADAKPDVEEPGNDEADDDDGATTFVKSFTDINLRLKVTGDSYATAKRILHLEGGKGIPIKLEYKIEQLPTGRYSMDYKVYKGKKQIGDEESITFEASDGKIDLGFKVKLYDPTDFGSVESITIVELD
jgi:hypothetical protein